MHRKEKHEAMREEFRYPRRLFDCISLKTVSNGIEYSVHPQTWPVWTVCSRVTRY